MQIMICDIITDHIGSLNHYVLTTTDSRIRAERYYKTKYLTPPVDQILIDKFQLVSAVPIHHVAFILLRYHSIDNFVVLFTNFNIYAPSPPPYCWDISTTRYGHCQPKILGH